ncbi:hypothetical protein AB395_00003591 [Sinorhizobium fredii CCBAU 45436]|nr:hypothetical protein AB395_00003591 [Sinorhizobium fredii CCBAU 45436]AWM26893.1 hypothetical protein AOX55_00003663 [Sinorhizobium fredii CCBAU 25509]
MIAQTPGFARFRPRQVLCGAVFIIIFVHRHAGAPQRRLGVS